MSNAHHFYHSEHCNYHHQPQCKHTALLLKAKVLAWDQDLNAKVALCCLYTVINIPQLAHVYAVVNHISYLICALTANVC